MIDIKTSKENDITLLEVHGEVDASSSLQLDDAFKAAMAADKRIMVDLSNLEYISSAGLGVFVSQIEEVKNLNIQLVLFGLSESVLQIFSLLGLQELLDIVTNKEEAVSKLS